METARCSNNVYFGPFNLDLRAGELQKDGRKTRLQEQPFQILRMLLEHPGEVVTREEIRRKLWPNDTIVEFDHSINAAIKKVRLALGDSAEQPEYVETVARRGYRFIAPVQTSVGTFREAARQEVDSSPQEAHSRRIGRRHMIALAAALILVPVVAIWLGILRSSSS